jgi:hypothetical protein
MASILRFFACSTHRYPFPETRRVNTRDARCPPEKPSGRVQFREKAVWRAKRLLPSHALLFPAPSIHPSTTPAPRLGGLCFPLSPFTPGSPAHPRIPTVRPRSRGPPPRAAAGGYATPPTRCFPRRGFGIPKATPVPPPRPGRGPPRGGGRAPPVSVARGRPRPGPSSRQRAAGARSKRGTAAAAACGRGSGLGQWGRGVLWLAGGRNGRRSRPPREKGRRRVNFPAGCVLGCRVPSTGGNGGLVPFHVAAKPVADTGATEGNESEISSSILARYKLAIRRGFPCGRHCELVGVPAPFPDGTTKIRRFERSMPLPLASSSCTAG